MIKAIRGMNDILPDRCHLWRALEGTLASVAKRYAYREIRLPIVEHAEVFVRTIGEHTDVVHKEMYAFEDRNGDHLSLRPEGTAGCMRANIEHHLTYGQPQRLFYMGPMFRHERPQKGRYRQFHHFGLEAIGFSGIAIEVELILLMTQTFRELGVANRLALQLNSLGNQAARLSHKKALIAFLQQHHDALDEDSQKRLMTNPLRILDSKNPQTRELLAQAPALLDHFDPDSLAHFDALKTALDAVGIAYTVNPTLVRGLDYYTHTVFEWVSDGLGAQGTVCGGGRYDGLMAQMGGQDTPAVGLAMGLERLLLLMNDATSVVTDIYVVYDPSVLHQALSITESLREAFPKCCIQFDGGGGSFKSQFKRANKANARLAIVLGVDEVQNQMVSVKFLQEDREQQSIDNQGLLAFIRQTLNQAKE